MTFTRKSSSMKRLCWSSAMEPKNSTSKPSSANTVLVLEALPPRVLEWKILFLIFTGSALLENNKGHWPRGLCTLLSVNKLFWLFHFHRYLAPLDSKSQCTLPRSFVSRWFVPLSQAKQQLKAEVPEVQSYANVHLHWSRVLMSVSSTGNLSTKLTTSTQTRPTHNIRRGVILAFTEVLRTLLARSRLLGRHSSSFKSHPLL